MDPVVVISGGGIIGNYISSRLDLNSIQSIVVEKEIRNIDGISQVSVSGFPDEEVEISISDDDLLRYNLSFDEVIVLSELYFYHLLF